HLVRPVQGADAAGHLELLRPVAAAAAEPVPWPDDRPLRTGVLRHGQAVRRAAAAVRARGGVLQCGALESRWAISQSIRELRSDLEPWNRDSEPRARRRRRTRQSTAGAGCPE